MPDPTDSPALAGDALERLGVVVLARPRAGGDFRLASAAPDWWEAWFGSAAAFTERSAFLEDFVSGAAHGHWERGEAGNLRSGMWEETGAAGQSRFFEAIACRSEPEDADLLLIQPADERLSREQSILQSVHDQRLDRRRLQKELEKKQILLECIMHDLGNPLATVLMNLQHLGRQLGERADLLPAVTRAITQAERQRSLIRSIAEVFASDLAGAGARGTESGEPVDLVAVAAQTITALTPLAARKSVTLCPFFASVCAVAAEAFPLGRVIENLLVNAIRHSPEGGRVTMSFDREERHAVCRIDDEGPGIDETAAARLFKPFSQGAGNTGQSGLGLYFCRMTLEQWGGRIEGRNRPEGGARFEFHLPCSPPR